MSAGDKARHAETEKRRQKRWRDQGLCPRCTQHRKVAKNRKGKKMSHCIACLDLIAEQQRRWQQRR